MRLGERTPSRCFRAAVMAIEMLACRAPEFPDARIGRPLRVTQLNRADRLVDRQAGIAKSQAKPLQNDVGIADVTRFADQPVAHRERKAEPLVGKCCGRIGHSSSLKACHIAQGTQSPRS